MVVTEKEKACLTPSSCCTVLQFDAPDQYVVTECELGIMGSDSPKASRNVYKSVCGDRKMATLGRYKS